MDKLTTLCRLEAKLDRALGTQPDLEFSLLGGLAIGGAAHLAVNAAAKRMLKPGTVMQRLGSSIFQKGVRDAKTQRVLHPALLNVAKVALGPEASHLYDAGRHSSRRIRKGIASMPFNGDVGRGMQGIVAGKRSKVADTLLKWAPTVDKRRGEKLRDSIPAAVTGAAITGGFHDLAYPLVNSVRSAVADSAWGKRKMREAMVKGGYDGPQKGLRRHLQDYVVTPSLNVARDAGSTAQGHMPPRPIKERPKWRKLLDDQFYQG